MNLDFVALEYELRSSAAAPLAGMLYSSLHHLNNYIQTACCHTPQQTCAACHSSGECPYHQLFAQQLSADPDIVRIHQKPSLPFAVQVGRPAISSDLCTVGLTIIGTAINQIQLFHTAMLEFIKAVVEEVAEKDSYSIIFYTKDYRGTRNEIALSSVLAEKVILLSGAHLLHNELPADHIRITLKSPLRLPGDGTAAHHFDFAAFFRSQLRRCSSLWAYYGTGALPFDFAALSEAVRFVTLLENSVYRERWFSQGQQGKSGVMGTVECDGLIEPMYALLQLGSYFNAGKGAAYGAGHYQLEAL